MLALWDDWSMQYWGLALYHCGRKIWSFRYYRPPVPSCAMCCLCINHFSVWLMCLLFIFTLLILLNKKVKHSWTPASERIISEWYTNKIGKDIPDRVGWCVRILNSDNVDRRILHTEWYCTHTDTVHTLILYIEWYCILTDTVLCRV